MRVLDVVLAVLMAPGLVALGASGGIAAGLSPDRPSFFVSAVAIILLTVPPTALGVSLQGRPVTVLAEGPPDPASVVLLALLIVTYAALLPVTRRLWKRARAHAARHEDVLAPN